MRCCGGRRAQLLREARREPRAAEAVEPDNPAPERSNRVFEYAGRGTLTVRGAVSGRSYHFRFRGDRVEVAHDDAFAMLAEPHVRPVAQRRR